MTILILLPTVVYVVNIRIEVITVIIEAMAFFETISNHYLFTITLIKASYILISKISIESMNQV